MSLEDRISALVTKDSNKLKVYQGEKKFLIELNGENHLILGSTIVEYDGKQLTGEQLYELLQNSPP